MWKFFNHDDFHNMRGSSGGIGYVDMSNLLSAVDAMYVGMLKNVKMIL